MSEFLDSPINTKDDNQLVKRGINVHKFGGSSLANEKCIDRVVGIIQKNCQLNDLVVVSASGDTTDEIFALYELASNDDVKWVAALTALQENQAALISSLLSEHHAGQLLKTLTTDIAQLKTWLSEDLAIHKSDILAFGELWSARLVSAVLNERVCPSYYLDARDFLVVKDSIDCELVFDKSVAQFNQFKQFGKLAVVTGYISKDSNGKTCTLGRNGSDYSATIMAALNNADNVTLWTDVDGIYSADPRVVPNARKLHRLPNGVAKELGRLGNPVLHAKTLQPLTNEKAKKVTHLHVASSFDLEAAGTEIGHFGQIAKQELSVTYLNELYLVKSESLKALEQGDLSFAVFHHDRKVGFVIVDSTQLPVAQQFLSLKESEVETSEVSIIAAVAHKITEHSHVRSMFKRALAEMDCQQIVSSDSRHSLIAILNETVTGEHLNNVHYALTKDARHVGIVVAGLGNIGQRFLELLPEQLTQVSVLENVHLVGLVASKKALINTDGIDANNAMALFQEESKPYDNEQLLSWLINHPYDELVVVDITPSEDFSLLYKRFFEQGIHVIGANKWAASSHNDNYQALKKASEKNHALWLGNTTVGAGLPINYAIHDVLRSGDKIAEISGIFSGTLSWLFNRYDGSQSFSSLTLEALNEGLTEPDPRDDLSGKDVQRKLLILARMAGFTLSLDDIECQNLVPEALQNLSKDEFLARIEEVDEYFAEQLAQAKEQGKCIRYIARFDASSGQLKAKVSLERLSPADAFANLAPCDNIFQITSGWYQENPLIIRGPGAGRDVTAGGLHSDLVKVCLQLMNKQNLVKIKGINS